ncbi:DNA-binding GntR family transcriptional regulator [Paenibacillus rhizosphaerae]|uniref:DNA-binding GntR family transcriptional regulator n=1 Tax=Paenibacillus rhizosphaerae TaxID=297318 RepID=A0A839TLZ7_9BACL|nr:GntR family transcriptional regulator [Paenibacillus rhizosphaerae]MBB3126760.1 DNA-binding GntR family transcriptional regulator [Paenibacillus rhizosphaerae]
MSSPTLETRAYQELRRRIIYAEYLPGTLLSENDLAEQLQMSRTPIRAAISLLVTEGFVESFRGRGVLVKDLTFREYAEILELLISMQVYVINTAERRELTFDLHTLRKHLERQIQAKEDDDISGYYESFLDFIETIIRTLHNQHMLNVMEQSKGKILYKMISYRKLYPQYKPHKSLDSNQKAYDALVQGDLAAAKAALLEIYTVTYEQLITNGII